MLDLARILKEGLGTDAKKVPTRKLPDWFVRCAGLFDGENPRTIVRAWKGKAAVELEGRNQLGWSRRPVEETIVDTATSLRAVGALR